MSFVGRMSLSLLLTSFLAAGPVEAAKQSQPRLSGFQARVAQGGKVVLAASKLTPSDLATLRPGYDNLKPRTRSNAE